MKENHIFQITVVHKFYQKNEEKNIYLPSSMSSVGRSTYLKLTGQIPLL